MEATMAAERLKSGGPSASLDQPQCPGWPCPDRTSLYPSSYSTGGFLSWRTCPFLHTCHLPILQIPFYAKKPSLTLGLCSWPSALASLGGTPLSAPLWCPPLCGQEPWRALAALVSPLIKDSQGPSLCTELRSLGLPVGSSHTGQGEGRVSCPGAQLVGLQADGTELASLVSSLPQCCS